MLPVLTVFGECSITTIQKSYIIWLLISIFIVFITLLTVNAVINNSESIQLTSSPNAYNGHVEESTIVLQNFDSEVYDLLSATPKNLVITQNNNKSVSHSSPEESTSGISVPNTLATEVSGISIENDAFGHEYLSRNNHFQNLNFKPIDEEYTTEIKEGYSYFDPKGYIINNKGYVIHLIKCVRELQGCYFRINGLSTGKLQAGDEYTLDETHSLHIESIEYDYCDNKRFCDYYYDAYDKVEIEIQSYNEPQIEMIGK